MGTVHAKSEVREPVTGNVDYPQPVAETVQIKLDGVQARVDRVHVEGLGRTQDDIVRATLADLFVAQDFEEVVYKANEIRQKLESMGCFKQIGVFIDVSSGPQATANGLEVTYKVQELKRIVGGINTTVGENEGNLVLGCKMPNVLGRGERVQAEYSVGYRTNSNFSIQASKPYPHKPLAPVISANVFQQSSQYPWSGYRLLDRGLLLDLAFRTSPTTKHSLQWEGVFRNTSVLSKNTSFKVRESCGPCLKSAVRHIVTVDGRDDPVFPRSGALAQLSSELAGLGGSVAYLKADLQLQQNFSVNPDFVVQLSGSGGVMHEMHGAMVCDRLYLGGPTTLRGFTQRGVGPHADACATGGTWYWALGVHLFAPLPFRPGRGGLGELFRSHLFLNAGSLLPPEESVSSAMERWWEEMRLSAGLGVALRLGSVARAELNYCWPVRTRPGDVTMPGLQFGVGVHFL